MPNKETFSIPPIKKLLQEEVTGGLWVDPFSNGKRITENTIINDLNPEICADYHMDALDFLKQFADESVDGVLYDPPYSLRQVVECYKGFGREVTQETTQASWRSRHLDEISRILKPGGKAICFGWNSSGVGKTRGFELHRILLVPHGGSKNDTIVTVEYKKRNSTRDAHDPMQNFVNALYERDKGRYLPVFMAACEEYGFKGLCGKDCPEYGSKDECKEE